MLHGLSPRILRPGSPSPPLSPQIVDIHMLVTLATAGAIALADYVEAAAVVVLFAVAEHWERCSTDKASGAWWRAALAPAPHLCAHDAQRLLVQPARLPARLLGQRSRLRAGALTLH